jgi:hypothetical protein
MEAVMTSMKLPEFDEFAHKNSLYLKPLGETDLSRVNEFLQKVPGQVNTEEIAAFVMFNYNHEIVGLYETSSEAFQNAVEGGFSLYWVQ